MTRLAALKPNTAFAVNGRHGVLLHVNPCRAYVRWQGTPREVSVEGRTFLASGDRLDSIAPNTEVETGKEEHR